MPQISTSLSALGIDVGEARIGLAITTQGIVTPFETVPARQRQKAAAHIAAVIVARSVDVVVVGWPLNMDGTQGRATRRVSRFVESLTKALEAIEGAVMPEVVKWDERLTTTAAEAHLIGTGMRREKRKQVVDQVAAMHILNGYCDSLFEPLVQEEEQ